MSKQKHFKYESQEPQIASPSLGEVEITDLRFLTPAKVSMKIDGVQTEEILSIDLITRKAYKGNEEVVYSDKVFYYLDTINNLPENFFEASEDIYKQAEEAKAEHAQMQDIGEKYGKT